MFEYVEHRENLYLMSYYFLPFFLLFFVNYNEPSLALKFWSLLAIVLIEV